MFKDLSKNIGTVTVVALLLSYYDLHSYYAHFGINIASFIEPTEIIFSFTWLYGVLIQILMVSASYALIKWIELSDEKKQVAEQKALSANELKRQLYSSLIISWTLILVGAGVLCYFIYNQSPSELRDSDLFLYAFFILVLFALAWAGVTMVKNIRTKTQGVQFGTVSVTSPWSLVLIAFGIFAFLITRNSIRSNNITSGHPKSDITATLEGRLYQTNDSMLYIGSTQKYILFYNIKKKEATVIPEREIKSLVIKELRTTL